MAAAGEFHRDALLFAGRPDAAAGNHSGKDYIGRVPGERHGLGKKTPEDSHRGERQPRVLHQSGVLDVRERGTEHAAGRRRSGAHRERRTAGGDAGRPSGSCGRGLARPDVACAGTGPGRPGRRLSPERNGRGAAHHDRSGRASREEDAPWVLRLSGRREEALVAGAYEVVPGVRESAGGGGTNGPLPLRPGFGNHPLHGGGGGSGSPRRGCRFGTGVGLLPRAGRDDRVYRDCRKRPVHPGMRASGKGAWRAVFRSAAAAVRRRRRPLPYGNEDPLPVQYSAGLAVGVLCRECGDLSTINMQRRTAIIIGAGPAGLTAAYEMIARAGVQPIVLEMSEYMGGLARTINYKGNRIDIGGHRFFSKSDRVMEWWFSFLPLQSLGDTGARIKYQGGQRSVAGAAAAPDPERENRVMLLRNRLSRILFTGRFFSYPRSEEHTSELQ